MASTGDSLRAWFCVTTVCTFLEKHRFTVKQTAIWQSW